MALRPVLNGIGNLVERLEVSPVFDKSARQINRWTESTRGVLRIRPDGFVAKNLQWWYENVRERALPKRTILCTDFWIVLLFAPIGRMIQWIYRTLKHHKSARIVALVLAVLWASLTLYVSWLFVVKMLAVILGAFLVIWGFNLANAWVVRYTLGNKYKQSWQLPSTFRFIQVALDVLASPVGAILFIIANLFVMTVILLAESVPRILKVVTWPIRSSWRLEIVQKIVHVRLFNYNIFWYIALAGLCVTALITQEAWPLICCAGMWLVMMIILVIHFWDEMWELKEERRERQMQAALDEIFRSAFVATHPEGFSKKAYKTWRRAHINDLKSRWGKRAWARRAFVDNEFRWLLLGLSYNDEKIQPARDLYNQWRQRLCPDVIRREKRKEKRDDFFNGVEDKFGDFVEVLSVGWAVIKAGKSKICPYVEIRPNAEATAQAPLEPAR